MSINALKNSPARPNNNPGDNFLTLVTAISLPPGIKGQIAIVQTAASYPGWTTIASMDVKSLTELLTGKPAASQTGDLLSQLKAAGTVEAEVIKVLQGKLLLSSRFGDILTTNTLNYKTGDQINLRLGGDEQNPVLKASPRVPRPVTLDSGQNPRLSRALPQDQPVLAVVSRITAQHIEIRLAGQILTLPRQAGVTRNQLLSLQRNDARRSIEITPLDRKLIYKGLLKQLVPDQPKSNPASLVRLLDLVSKAVETAQSRAAPTPDFSPQSPAKSGAKKIQWVETQPATTQLKIRPTTTQFGPRPATIAGKAQLSPKTDVEIPLPAAKTTVLSPLATLASNKKIPPESNRLLGVLLRQINRAGPKPGAPTIPVKPATSHPGSVPLAAPNNPSIVAQKVALPGIDKISGEAVDDNQIVSRTSGPTNTRLPTQPRPSFPNRHPALTQGGEPGEINSTQPPPRASVAPTLFQKLLQMVPKLADINATQIKLWFEVASLTRAPTTKSGASISTDSLQMLKQLVDKDAFHRELDLTIQPRNKSSAVGETAAAKSIPQEILLAQVRDGVKLVEQTLSQNLLQRASVGMQQETQQPLTLSFALPFFDQQEVKQLQIDLAQRDQPQEDKDKSWDIRLSFELADLGPVACHIFLQDVTVAASFYCEKSQTRIRVEQALPELKQQLSGAGFTAGEFHSFPGKPDQAQISSTTSYAESLIDIEV